MSLIDEKQQFDIDNKVNVKEVVRADSYTSAPPDYDTLNIPANEALRASESYLRNRGHPIEPVSTLSQRFRVATRRSQVSSGYPFPNILANHGVTEQDWAHFSNDLKAMATLNIYDRFLALSAAFGIALCVPVFLPGRMFKEVLVVRESTKLKLKRPVGNGGCCSSQRLESKTKQRCGGCYPSNGSSCGDSKPDVDSSGLNTLNKCMTNWNTEFFNRRNMKVSLVRHNSEGCACDKDFESLPVVDQSGELMRPMCQSCRGRRCQSWTRISVLVEPLDATEIIA